jgi:hypothetical protein
MQLDHMQFITGFQCLEPKIRFSGLTCYYVFSHVRTLPFLEALIWSILRSFPDIGGQIGWFFCPRVERQIDLFFGVL